MKRLVFEPIHESLRVQTQSSVLDALLSKELDVLMACGGKGLCATCHVHVQSGAQDLTPMTEREQRTLSFVSGCQPDSRLACQARILGENVVVQLPEGMFIERAEDLNVFLGTRAKTNILHPINATILIAKGKIITKSRIRELESLNMDVQKLKQSDV